MASHIYAGIPSSKWVNPPKLSPYKNCTPLVPNRLLCIYIRLILNCHPIITLSLFVLPTFKLKNQGLTL